MRRGIHSPASFLLPPSATDCANHESRARCHELRILARLEEGAKEEEGIASQDVGGNGRGGPTLQVRYRLMEDFMRLHAPSFELAWTTSIWASTKNDPFTFDFQRRILKVDYRYRPDSKGDPSRAFEIILCRFHKLHEIAPKLRIDLNARKPLFEERIGRMKAKHPDRPIRVLYILSIVDKQAWIWSFFPVFETLPARKEQYVRTATPASWLQDLKNHLEVGLIYDPNNVTSTTRGRLRRKGNKWIWAAEQDFGSTKEKTPGVEEQPEET